ncbi:hypothetical protein T458_16630 [Brevibacillus panacihumi W25]|uniref:Uncharacterized protein n=1 Tax=Brevibacillus panacihumi W25 TaxID=1408254 RepID=V6M7F3_9BACL|nr:hypothetical protein [Brevibacillus panacihumi]EST53820.1 hypothetical protein T458_16630 [Brevibacillus panacihumi W25]
MSLYDIHVGKLLNGKRKFDGHGFFMYTKEGDLNELNDLQGSTGVVVDSKKIEDLLFQHCTETINKFANTDENCIWQAKNAEFGNHFVHSLARLNFHNFNGGKEHAEGDSSLL